MQIYSEIAKIDSDFKIIEIVVKLKFQHHLMEYTSFDDLKNLLGTEVSGRRVYKSSLQTRGLGLGGFAGTMKQ